MKYMHKLRLESWLSDFQKFLMDIPAAETPVDLLDWSPYSTAGVGQPLYFSFHVAGAFRFAPPVSATFTGSFSNGTVTKQSLVLDLMIQMPRSCVGIKDARDGRWLLKRAHYLCHLATALQQCQLVQQETSWTLHLGEPLRPALLVSPNLSGGASKWKVMLLPVPCEGTFKCHTFSPQKANVRNKGSLPCPRLNFLCAVDTEMALGNRSLQQLLTMQGLVDGIQLAKVWLSQRQLDKGRGALSGHVLAQIVLHLFRVGRVYAQSSGYQVFEQLITYLSEFNLAGSGINMFEDLNKGENVKNPFANTLLDTATYQRFYSVVIVSPTGYCNLAGNLSLQFSKWFDQEVIHCRQNFTTDQVFDHVFINKYNFDLVFDQSIHIKIKRAALANFYSSDKASTKIHLLDQLHPSVVGETPSNDSGIESNKQEKGKDTVTVISDPVSMISEIGALIEKGLGPRATLVGLKLEPAPVWGLGEQAPAPKTTVTFGLRLDPSCAWNLHLKNPDIDKSESFRKFWGPKCKLLRFKDGMQSETVVWGEGNEGEGDRRTIPGKIVQYLLNRHFKIKRQYVHVVGPQLENMLRLPLAFEGSKEYCTGEECCVAAVQAYDALCRQLRSSDATKPVLKVANIVSSDPALAHGAVFPRQIINQMLPATEQLQKALEVCDPIEVLVFMEIRGMWPDDLVSVEQMRHVLHVELAEELKKQRVAVALELHHLLVVMQGYAFRVRVTYQGEVLLRQALAPEYVGAEEEQLSHYNKASLKLMFQTTITPRITTALAALGGKHPSYGSAVRMCRRWLSSVLLEPHMPALATQLLVAHLYTTPRLFETPNTPSVAFLRFLSLLATANLEQTPFFVNLNKEFEEEDLKELKKRFDAPASRSLLPFLFIATPYDIRGGAACTKKLFKYTFVSHCTQERPIKMMISLIEKVAATALEICQSMLYQKNFNLINFCQPEEFLFNMVIHLIPSKVPCLEENIKYDSLKPTAVHSTVAPGKRVKNKMTTASKEYLENLLQFLHDRYNEYSITHYDSNGGNVVALSMIPGALDERDYPEGDVRPEFELLSSTPRNRARLSPQLMAELIVGQFDSIIQKVFIYVK